MTRAVIFDMFETLITHYQSPLYFGAQMAEDAGIPEDKFQSLWRPTEFDRTIGKLTLEEVVEMILRENHCYSEPLLKKLLDKRIVAKEECFRHLHSEILCLGNIQMEGTAIIKGHPKLPENETETAIFLNKSKKEIEQYMKYKNMVLNEVVVNRVELWKNNGREYLDINKEEAYRVG